MEGEKAPIDNFPNASTMNSMTESSAIHLYLRTPLTYTQAPELVPFACQQPECETAEELLFCFELDREQAGTIEPQAAYFPGTLVFAAKSRRDTTARKQVQLPAGLYLFVQERRALNREECIALAIEQQKDGLWEQNKPGTRLYIRYLFEDGNTVTQLFRPC